MDKLHLLKLFVAVVDHGGFASAAVALGLSPSTVSKAMARLETDLQLFLFHRTTRRLTLTDSGQAYAQSVRKLLQELDACEETLAQNNDDPTGRLSINLPVSYGRRYVMPLVANFHRLYPDIRLDISFDDAYVDMIARGVDVCIRSGTLEDSQLVARQLSPIDFLICAAPGFIQKQKKWRDLQLLPVTDFSQVPWIRFRFRQTGRLMPIMHAGPEGQINLDPGRQFIVDDGEALAELCAQGLGLTQMPHFIARDWLASQAIVPVAPHYRPPGFGVWAIYVKRAFQPARIRVFVEFLEQSIRGQHETPLSTWAESLSLVP